ncbi:MAG: preprotein translocase subunit SecE [SAR324 cluster bacterium]|nr:preprotein translocase subunit SecE [SAR324 cluster bacterium]
MFSKFKQFLDDIRAEFKKVHWPDRDETIKATSIVLALSLIVAVFLGVADLGLSSIMKMIIS